MGSIRIFMNWLVVSLLLLAAIVLHLIWGYRQYYANTGIGPLRSSIHNFKKPETISSTPTTAEHDNKPAPAPTNGSSLTFDTEEIKLMFSNAPPEEKAAILLSKIDSLNRRLKSIENQHNGNAVHSIDSHPIQISNLMLQALQEDRTITQQASLAKLFQVSFHLRSKQALSGELNIVIRNVADRTQTDAGVRRNFYYIKKIKIETPDQRISFSLPIDLVTPGIYLTDIYYEENRIASFQKEFY